jgi:RND family efflux transporter MFP subunit
VRAAPVTEVVSAYGLVQADPSGAATVAAPRAVIVSRVLVRLGEAVAAGQPLVELGDAPASAVAYRQATDAAAFAKTDLARVERLYEDRLAGADQLSAARKTLADADAALAAQTQEGGGQSRQVLRAPFAGVVTVLTANPGDHLAQDASMLTLGRSGAETVKLGLEPANAGRVAAGQPVTLKPSGGGAQIESRLSLVGRAADPTTKLLDAVAPLNGAALPIGAAVEAEIATSRHEGLVVPRASVVFDETGPHLFTVAGGKAHRVFVKVGRDQGDDIEISGPIAAGALVVVEGALELQDGMAVKVHKP